MRRRRFVSLSATDCRATRTRRAKVCGEWSHQKGIAEARLRNRAGDGARQEAHSESQARMRLILKVLGSLFPVLGSQAVAPIEPATESKCAPRLADGTWIGAK